MFFEIRIGYISSVVKPWLRHSVFQRTEGWQFRPTMCLSSRKEKRLLSTGIL